MSELAPCLCGTQNELKQVGTSHFMISCPTCMASTGFRPSQRDAEIAWKRLVIPQYMVLTAAQIDDMGFGYVPSGEIGELREFAQAILATAQDHVKTVADIEDEAFERAAKACEARIANPDPSTWGMSESAAYDAEDMACAAAVRALKNKQEVKPQRKKKGAK